MPKLFLLKKTVKLLLFFLINLLVIYRMDKIEREPPRMLMGLFFKGLLAMFPILILELLASQLVDFFSWSYLGYLFLSYFCIPGFIEEGVKYRILKKNTWNDPNFNFRFDAVVYSVFVSLGFAAVENVMYVLSNGFSTAVLRAIFSIPGHAMFGVVMGVGFGTASHVIGTSRATQLDPLAGAVSSLSLAVAGILTAVVFPMILMLL